VKGQKQILNTTAASISGIKSVCSLLMSPDLFLHVHYKAVEQVDVQRSLQGPRKSVFGDFGLVLSGIYEGKETRPSNVEINKQ